MFVSDKDREGGGSLATFMELCVCDREEDGTLATFMDCVFVPEKGIEFLLFIISK